MLDNFSHYLQLDAMDCGPTCFRMIAKYYGRSYTLQTIIHSIFWKLFLLILLFTCCKAKEKKEVIEIIVPTDLPLIDLRGLYPDGQKGESILLSAIDSIEYIQLDSMVPLQGVLDFEITNDHIFVVASHQEGMHMYDRKGRHIKNITLGELHSLTSDEDTRLLYNYGSSEYVFAYSMMDGEMLGVAEKIHNTPPNTFLYPMGDNLFLTSQIVNKKNEMLDSFEVAVYNNLGDKIRPVLNVHRNDIRDMLGEFLITTPLIDGLLFLPAVPYREPTTHYTVYRATKDGIQPAYYFLIDKNWQVNYLRVIDNKLIFYLQNYKNGSDDIIVEYDLSAQIIANVSVPKHNKYRGKKMRTYLRLVGINNKIDNGFPVYGRKHFLRHQILADVFLAKDLAPYFAEDKANEEIPEIFREIKKDENPIIAIYYLNKKSN